MHFIVSTEDINYALSMAMKALSVRPVKQIYDGILIEGDQDSLLLTSTDGDISIKVRIPADVQEDGHVLLPGRLFCDLMRYQPKGRVDVQVDENGRAKIKSDGTVSNMICMEDDDFPDIDDVQGGNVAYIKSGKMRDAVSKVMFAVSTDESRKILTGVLTEIYPSEMVFVGLDGFRLAMQTVQQENKMPEKSPDKISCVIPGRIMNEIKSMLPDDEETEAEIVFSSSRCMISFGSVRVYASLLTGEFIDYQRILPKTWTTEVRIDRNALSNAVDRCNLMAREGKNNLIHFSIKDNKLTMNANSEKGEVRDEIAIEFEGNAIDIAFNAKYLMDVIHNINTDDMCLCFNTNVSPCMVKPTEGRSYTFLLLPVRIFGR